MKKQLILSFLFLSFCLVPFSNIVAQGKKNSAKAQDDKSWPGYFKMFQAAVKSGDKAKVMSLCDFSAMSKDDFNDAYEYFFEEDAKKKIAKAKHKNAEKTEQDFEGLSNAKDFMLLNFRENGNNEDGEEYESALIYYFAKVKGKYRLVYLMAAG